MRGAVIWIRETTEDPAAAELDNLALLPAAIRAGTRSPIRKGRNRRRAERSKRLFIACRISP